MAVLIFLTAVLVCDAFTRASQKPIEPELEPSIGIVDDPAEGVAGRPFCDGRHATIGFTE